MWIEDESLLGPFRFLWTVNGLTSRALFLSKQTFGHFCILIKSCRKLGRRQCQGTGPMKQIGDSLGFISFQFAGASIVRQQRVPTAINETECSIEALADLSSMSEIFFLGGGCCCHSVHTHVEMGGVIVGRHLFPQLVQIVLRRCHPRFPQEIRSIPGISLKGLAGLLPQFVHVIW